MPALSDHFAAHIDFYYSLLLVLIKIGVFFGVFMTIVAYLTLLERRMLGFFQIRFGPNRVGPFGLLQPAADGLKSFMKEEMTVNTPHKVIFILAPVVTVITAFIPFAVIPFSEFFFPASLNIAGQTYNFTIASANKGVIADINVGLLYIFAISSLSVFGVMMAGWASNNKYSLLGGMRAGAQMISYELAMGLSIVGVIMFTGSLSMVDIVESQTKMWLGVIPQWNILRQPLAFVLFLICMFGETFRTPFDFIECENELVAGYQTEYSSMKFALFYMGEYAHIFTASAILVTLFLGGWHGPMIPATLGPIDFGVLTYINYFTPVVYFLIKTLLVVSFIIWVRATFPRFRYDKFMMFGWKVLLPATLINIMITPAIMWILGEI